MVCFREGRTQAAHRNQGKGMSIKTDDCFTAALCVECHAEIDQGMSSPATKDDEMKQRFSKQAALEQLDKWAGKIAREQNFDRNNGTSQLGPLLTPDGEAMLDRAVQYGKMRALERFAEMVEEGFIFDEHGKDA